MSKSKSVQLKNNKNEKIYPHPYYPIGSIYLSVNSINPSKWFGGTWEQIAKGRTLVGVDTNDTDFDIVKKTGGSKYLQKHRHGNNENVPNTFGFAVMSLEQGQGLRSDGNKSWIKEMYNTGYPNDVSTGNSGNLQPYFTCYIWCRTA